MGIEPFLVASSINLVCAQRLVRRVCTHCQRVQTVLPEALVDAGFSREEAATTEVRSGTGCNRCNKSGYKGRAGLYEVMEMNDELRELILRGNSALDIRKKALEHGMITLRRSGLMKVAAGVTTLEEVLWETVL